MENVTRTAPESVQPMRALRWRVFVWLLVMLVLTLTFVSYGQVELLIQWVSAQLC